MRKQNHRATAATCVTREYEMLILMGDIDARK
jgi:hypothetical protein